MGPFKRVLTPRGFAEEKFDLPFRTFNYNEEYDSEERE